MRYRRSYYIICLIFMLTPLTLHGQVAVERLQELDKLMYNGIKGIVRESIRDNDSPS